MICTLRYVIEKPGRTSISRQGPAPSDEQTSLIGRCLRGRIQIPDHLPEFENKVHFVGGELPTSPAEASPRGAPTQSYGYANVCSTANLDGSDCPVFNSQKCRRFHCTQPRLFSDLQIHLAKFCFYAPMSFPRVQCNELHVNLRASQWEPGEPRSQKILLRHQKSD